VLRALLREICAQRPRWGYRRELGHHVNRKRVQRLWREEGLRVPARRRKRQRLGDRPLDCAPNGPIKSGRWTSSSTRSPTAGC
jgi:transposase InsO family protein